MKHPFVSIELLTYLRDIFPNQLPTKDDIDIEEVRRLQGIQHVITVLDGLHRQQQNLEE